MNCRTIRFSLEKCSTVGALYTHNQIIRGKTHEDIHQFFVWTRMELRNACLAPQSSHLHELSWNLAWSRASARMVLYTWYNRPCKMQTQQRFVTIVAWMYTNKLQHRSRKISEVSVSASLSIQQAWVLKHMDMCCVISNLCLVTLSHQAGQGVSPWRVGGSLSTIPCASPEKKDIPCALHR
jgi:hypothetical protein